MDKKKSRMIIMVTIAAAIAIAIAVVMLLTSNGRELKKQLNLGQKYLTEMNYEEAIATFEKALEIDPMSADAYLGIADAYIGMGDFESAKLKLEEGIEVLTLAKDNGNSKVSDESIEKLKKKLGEVQAEIARLEAEEEARIQAEEEEQRKAAEEEANRIIADIEIVPFLENMTVSGYKWDEVDVSALISKYGLEKTENEGQYARLLTSVGNIYSGRQVPDYAIIYIYGYLKNDETSFDMEMFHDERTFSAVEVHNENSGRITYSYNIACHDEDVPYAFISANGIYDLDGMGKYFFKDKWEEIREREYGKVNTEYGEAYFSKDDQAIHFMLSEESAVGRLQVSMIYDENTGYRIYLDKQSK